MSVWPAIVTVPDRDCSEPFAAAVKLTEPLPLPVAPPVTVSHVALLTALHEQPVGAETLAVLDPPLALTLRLVGEIEYVHPVPDCVTVKVWPAIVIVPLRWVVLVLAATVNATVPFPDPLAPVEIAIHDAPLVAVQLQPVVAATVAVEDSPVAGDVRPVGDSENVHAAAVCVTVKAWPATVNDPVRSVPAVFAATEYETVPLPDPLAPPVTVIHDAPLAAVQEHPVGAVTPVLFDSPAAEAVRLVGVNEYVHPAAA
ncbi:MAG TPA: hypothetical protein VFJ02_09105 [Vicinamibacterales bacterium]|nr:hypothetical protein [Vicinamibacterales bacterium]